MYRTYIRFEATNEELIVNLHAWNVFGEFGLAAGEFYFIETRFLSMNSVAGAFRDRDLNRLHVKDALIFAFFTFVGL